MSVGSLVETVICLLQERQTVWTISRTAQAAGRRPRDHVPGLRGRVVRTVLMPAVRAEPRAGAQNRGIVDLSPVKNGVRGGPQVLLR